MKIAIASISYNRPKHLEQVLLALRASLAEYGDENAFPVFFFQDGLRSEVDRCAWEENRLLIEKSSWIKDKRVFCPKENKGLANNIIDGINTVFCEYDAVIVIEDDCVPLPGFISYMVQCLYKYECEKKVFHINGFSYQGNFSEKEKAGYDAFACGRTSPWGWGTWKNRWQLYKRDVEVIWNIRMNEQTSLQYAKWGGNLEIQVIHNVQGKNNIWHAWWALRVIEKNGIGIMPYKSLVNNIGFDGSGEHCPSTHNMYMAELLCDKKKNYNLPDCIEISKLTEERLNPFFGRKLALDSNIDNRKKVLVYDVEDEYVSKEEIIIQKYSIVGFVDPKLHGFYIGRPVIRLQEVKEYKFDYIVILSSDETKHVSITNDLIQHGIRKSEIIFL